MTAPLYTDFPYRFGADGLTARTTRIDHVRDLLEQLLFTRPGERPTCCSVRSARKSPPRRRR